MKKLIALSLLSLLVSGCIVSQQTYQEQYVRASELEDKNKDISNQLGAEKRKSTMLKTNVVELETRLAEARAQIGQLEESLNDTSSRLEICMESSDMTSGDLDMARKVLRGAEEENKKFKGEIERLSAELEQLKKSSSEKVAKLKEVGEGEVARLDKRLKEKAAEVEALRTRISLVEADNAVLTEQRDKLEDEKQQKLKELTASYEGLLEDMEEEIAEGQVVISQLKGQLSVQMLNEILFPSGSAKLRSEGRDVLDQVGSALAGLTDKAIVIEGHTDNIPIEGTLANRYPTNWELSTARAVSVVRYLVEIAGLDPLRISAVGLGEFHPVADNETEEGRAANRRIEIKLVPIEEFSPQEEAPVEQEVLEEEPAEESTGEESGLEEDGQDSKESADAEAGEQESLDSQ